MRIFVIGGGGRENALVWKLAASPRVKKIFCAPGNPGIARLAECVQLDINDNQALLKFAQEQAVDLTVVGPEQPLANGVVDVFKAKGLRIFGPSRAAAQIEGSKAFAKNLMLKYGIPTAHFAVFTEADAAKAHIRKFGAPLVVKADGLAAGKGVVVAQTINEALNAVDMMMGGRTFGEAGARVVIEEFMEGEEASLLTFTDGLTVVPMISAQDHKRIFDGDKGPNTGGMGAYAPAPVVTPALLERITREILQPTVDAMRQEGILYRGCLYAGLMMTEKGPKVVEFNARFGDPETQVVLPLLASDIVEVMEACIDGKLADIEVKWKDGAAVCVVMAAAGYPGDYRKGEKITGLKDAEAADAIVFHAGTVSDGERVLTGGGRVLGVTAEDSDIMKAIEKVYNAVGKINFTGMQFRRDIAYRAIARVK